MTSCAVCKKEFKNVHGLAIHTARSHKTTSVLAPAPAPAPALTVEELVKKAFEEFRLSHNFDDLLSKMNTKTKTYAETAAAPAPVPAPVPAPAPPTPPESVSERRGNASLDFIFKRLGVSSSCDMAVGATSVATFMVTSVLQQSPSPWSLAKGTSESGCAICNRDR